MVLVAEEVAVLVVDIGSGTFMAGFGGDDASAAFPSFVACPRSSASWAVWKCPRSSSDLGSCMFMLSGGKRALVCGYGFVGTDCASLSVVWCF